MIKRLLIYLIFCLPVLSVFGGEIEVTDKNDFMQIGPLSHIRVDSFSAYSISNLDQLGVEYASENYIPNLGLSENTWWVNSEVVNKSNRRFFILHLNQPILNDVVLYIFKDGRLIDSTFVGESVSFSERDLKTNGPSFYIDIPPGEKRNLILKIRSNATFILDLELGSPERVYESNHTREILLSIYYGIIIVTFLYNLFIYFSSKEQIYFYYVLYIFLLFFIQFTLDGFGFKYLWPNSVWLSKQSFFLFTSFVNITGIEFVRRFINSKSLIPKIDKFHILLYIAYIVICGISLSGNRFAAYSVILPLAGVSALYMLTMGVIIARKKYRPARFFLIAWTPLIIGISVSVMKGFGFIEHNSFTNYSIQIGTAFEVILLSLALADKINIYRKEKEKSQEAELLLIKEKQELISNQNIMLEREVEERTHELNLAMANLKNAQSQLVESEKMSSLGQLTAGLAHEINNPVNFISSTIGPLRRDVEDVLEIVKKYEELNIDEVQKSNVEKFKKKIDFEYLKAEMPQLFDAILDGSKRTSAIVNGLRSFSRVDELDLKYVDLHEGIDSTLMLLRQQLGSKIIVEKNYGALPQVECYAGKLNQVFMNIISNAAYALNHSNTENPTIRITTEFDHENAYIKIADNGPGIPEDLRSRIFDPFYTTKPVGEGTGLGLSIVFSIIETHRGKITLSSQEQLQTEFIISIPLKQ